MGFFSKQVRVSTHSRPKAAGYYSLINQQQTKVSTHSRPKAAGWAHERAAEMVGMFQHTAARRRLANRGHKPPT